MTNNNFTGLNVYSFKNETTKDNAQLISGINSEKKPCYQISSKKIPITGEFTGFPAQVMIKWFQEMGYTFIGKFSLGHNYFKQA